MIIALASQKGGTGKTTTAAAIWAAFSRSLAVDLDVQGNLTLIANANTEPEHDIYDVLNGDCTAHEAIQNLPVGDVIASSEALADIGELSPVALRNALAPMAADYRHIVIDTPPNLNRLTVNALVAANVLIIPIQADVLSLRGLKQLQKILNVVREININLRIGGILLTRYNPRSNVRRQMHEIVEQFASSIGTKVFTSTIRDAVAVLEAQATYTDIFSYAPKAKVTQDYRNFMAELESVINHG